MRQLAENKGRSAWLTTYHDIMHCISPFITVIHRLPHATDREDCKGPLERSKLRTKTCRKFSHPHHCLCDASARGHHYKTQLALTLVLTQSLHLLEPPYQSSLASLL